MQSVSNTVRQKLPEFSRFRVSDFSARDTRAVGAGAAGPLAAALDAGGLRADRVIYAEAGKAATVLGSMQEGLRHAGLAGVVGEVSGGLTLTASRRLQLAAEQSGVTCFALKRSRRHDDAALAAPTAAERRQPNAAVPLADRPLITGVHDGRRQILAAVDRAARSQGLFPGMPVAQAKPWFLA